jgi:hypothetical protein
VKPVTLGHLEISSLADAVVTRRQLLPPKPSVRPKVIFFGPHQDGTPPDVAALVPVDAAVLAVVEAAALEPAPADEAAPAAPPEDELPHALARSAAAPKAAARRTDEGIWVM